MKKLYRFIKNALKRYGFRRAEGLPQPTFVRRDPISVDSVMDYIELLTKKLFWLLAGFHAVAWYAVEMWRSLVGG